MKKIDWKKVALDAVKAAVSVIIGALLGSCTANHQHAYVFRPQAQYR